jgi:hypothetical protein
MISSMWGDVMSDAFSAICQTVQDIITAEWKNLGAGIHRSATARAKAVLQREEKNTELRRLMGLALPVGIKAGATFETVEGRLNKLGLAVEALTHWEQAMERVDPVTIAYLDPSQEKWECQQTESLDDQAESLLLRLVQYAEAQLAAVENLAVAARDHEAATAKQKRKGGRPRLEHSNLLKLQIYQRIQHEHSPGEDYVLTVNRLKDDKDFMEQVRQANQKLDTKLVRRALAFSDQRKRDQRAKKQETHPA